MQKVHIPEQTRAERTTFKFTKDEVIQAMLNFIKTKGERPPVFLSFDDCRVCDNRDSSTYREPWRLALDIEHPIVEE